MSYGRIGECIAVALMAACAVGVAIGVVVMWATEGPVVIKVGTTVVVVAVAVMLLCFKMEDRNR